MDALARAVSYMTIGPRIAIVRAKDLKAEWVCLFESGFYCRV
jgi:hypothetical protein